MSAKTPPKYQPAPEIEWRQFDSEALLLNITNGHCYRLNAVGTQIWQMLHKHLTPEQICSELQLQYDLTAEQAYQDYQEFIAMLLKNHLIIPAPEQ